METRIWESKRRLLPPYRRRRPETTELYRIIYASRDGLPLVWEDRFQTDYGCLRDEVLKTIDSYLDCGIRSHGCARFVCESCNTLSQSPSPVKNGDYLNFGRFYFTGRVYKAGYFFSQGPSYVLYGGKTAVNGGRGFAKTIWRVVRELSAETKLHPHLLRHSYALDLLESSNDIRLVSQALGHSDIKVTMRYTERKDEEVARALEKARKGKK